MAKEGLIVLDSAMHVAVRQDVQTHLQAMETEGIDIAVCFAERKGYDRTPAATDYRAANQRLAAHCSTDPFKLRMAATIALYDPAEAAADARASVQSLKAVAIALAPNVKGAPDLSDAIHDPLWATVEELDVPIVLMAEGTMAVPEDLGALLLSGVLEHFPKLRAAYLRGDCSWAPWWLWRLDRQSERVGTRTKPSELFKRQCFVSVGPGETLVRQVVEVLGDENLVFCSDWPHDDSAYPQATEQFVRLPGLTLDNKRKILWDNCARLYRVGF